MNCRFKFAVLSIFVLMPSFAKSQDPDFHIFLLFGQSNMEGAGAIENQDKTGIDSRFQVMGAVNCTGNRSFTLGQWSTATPPLVRCYTGLGVGDYFGRTMVADLPAHIKVGVVPVAIGGCDIGLFDKVNYASYVASAPQWMKDIIDQYGGNPYERLVEVARLAQEAGVIKGILFHQGETNTNDQTWKNKVGQVVANLKADLELGDVPFLAGEMLTGQGACCSSHNVEVNKLPDVIPNAHVISSAGLTGADYAHFTSASYRTFGERYAEKMLELLDIDSHPITTVPDLSPENHIKIYPAPAVNGSFTIHNIENITRIELFNAVGGKIASFDNTNRSSSMDIRMKASSGILLLRLSNGQRAVYKKVLVQ